MEHKRNNRILPDLIMLAVFAVFIFGFAAALLIKGDREFSETENRNLAQKPNISWEDIRDGKFSEGLESYISDQLFAKDQLVSLKTDIDRLLGKNYQNGVYLVKDGGKLRYVQRYKENREQLAQNVGCLNGFAEGLNIPADFILVPNASAFMLDKLPAGADCDDQRESIEYVRSQLSGKIGFYPMTEIMSNNLDFYFKTDHHWSLEGAYASVDGYLHQSGQLASGEQTFCTSGTGIKDFYGTLYSKAPTAFADPDEFVYDEKCCGASSVEWVNEGKISDSILDRSFLEKKDKYAAYFGGNFAQIRIKTGHEGQRVLVLKDSYANSAMQFLMQQYSEVTMIDLRYYHMQEKSVSELCKEYGIDRVIMLYNLDFLNEDRNFIWLE